MVQTCEEGETAWVELADDGEDPHELENPAPTVTIGEAENDGHGDDDAPDAAAGHGDGSDDGGADEDGSDVTPMNIAGFGTGVAGVILGGAALLYARRRTRVER